jgi:hypothetical protein
MSTGRRESRSRTVARRTKIVGQAVVRLPAENPPDSDDAPYAYL